jgi:hypothetical protein
VDDPASIATISNNLQTLANIAEILGALTIVGGAIFGFAQLREFRAQRRQNIALELNRSFQDPAFARALNLIRGLPEEVTGEQLREKGPEYEEAAVLISTTYETIAFLVFSEMTSFSVVRELTGGIAIVMWRRLKGWMTLVRSETSQPSFAEYFQWLAEQLIRESEGKESNPAYIRHADWRPRV